MALCYATSSDGISWHKPDLGIIEYAGSRRNNLLARASHGPGVFKDLEESEAAKRYKMLFASDVPVARHGLSVRFSANGIHWAEAIAIDNKNAARGDAHHTCLWAPELKKYVACSRPMGWGERRSDQQDAPLRPISRTESEDFIHWSDAEIVLDPSELERQYYVMPICRYRRCLSGNANDLQCSQRPGALRTELESRHLGLVSRRAGHTIDRHFTAKRGL